MEKVCKNCKYLIYDIVSRGLPLCLKDDKLKDSSNDTCVYFKKEKESE